MTCIGQVIAWRTIRIGRWSHFALLAANLRAHLHPLQRVWHFLLSVVHPERAACGWKASNARETGG